MKKAFAAVAAAVLGLGLAGCGSKLTEPYKDAPVSERDGSAANVHSMPDGFGNWADKCDGHGHRVFVLFHHDAAYGGITAVADSTCPGGKQ